MQVLRMKRAGFGPLILAMATVTVMCGELIMTNHGMGQEAEPASEKPSASVTWAIAIHGGAGSSPADYSDEANASRHKALEAALETGKKILADGGTSLDAVEAVVRQMEDDPQFNAGKGSVFNAAGEHELDASIMDGRDKSCGAVAGVTIAKNPITLARLVMTETSHVMLAGPGADAFAEAQKVEVVENDYFDTPATRRKWEALRKSQKETSDDLRSQLLLDTGSYHGTVGCVAFDSRGNLAAATSTGGMPNKRFGRVGDSPIVGAGTWADNQSCAVSCTGIGEEFIRHAVAHDISARMKYQNVTLEAAITAILEDSLRPGDGGIIAVDRAGNVFMGNNTRGMSRAMADSSGNSQVFWLEK